MSIYNYITVGIVLIVHAGSLAYLLGVLSNKVQSNKENNDLQNDHVTQRIDSLKDYVDGKIFQIEVSFKRVIDNGISSKINQLDHRSMNQHDRLMNVENNVKWIKDRMEKLDDGHYDRRDASGN